MVYNETWSSHFPRGANPGRAPLTSLTSSPDCPLRPTTQAVRRRRVGGLDTVTWEELLRRVSPWAARTAAFVPLPVAASECPATAHHRPRRQPGAHAALLESVNAGDIVPIRNDLDLQEITPRPLAVTIDHVVTEYPGHHVATNRVKPNEVTKQHPCAATARRPRSPCRAMRESSCAGAGLLLAKELRVGRYPWGCGRHRMRRDGTSSPPIRTARPPAHSYDGCCWVMYSNDSIMVLTWLVAILANRSRGVFALCGSRVPCKSLNSMVSTRRNTPIS